nr:hypothetical protein BaRGS_029838 [Batillaria attramentaria]
MIFVLLCQTDLVNYIDSTRSVLFLIRLASFNPILDPWVYILFRRELVFRIVRLCRCVLRLDPLMPASQQRLLLNGQQANGKVGAGTEKGNGKVGSTKAGIFKEWRKSLDDPYDPSCTAFCYQCLCLPPAPRTSVVMSQSRGQSVTIGRSPSQAFRRTSSAEQMTAMTSRSPTRTPTRTPPRTPSRLVMTPPSPSEQLLLKKLSDLNGSSRSVNSNA